MPAYGEAIAELKKEGLLPKDTQHRQMKYLNNRLEGDRVIVTVLLGTDGQRNRPSSRHLANRRFSFPSHEGLIVSAAYA